MTPTSRGEQTRQRIHEHVQTNPGIGKQQLQQNLGIGWGTVIYNINVLSDLGQIQTREDRGHVRLFDFRVSRENQRFFCALRTKHSGAIIAELNEQGEIESYRIADQLGVSRKTIRRTLAHMHKHGFVHKLGQVKVRFKMTSDGKKFLEEQDLLGHAWSNS